MSTRSRSAKSPDKKEKWILEKRDAKEGYKACADQGALPADLLPAIRT